MTTLPASIAPLIDLNASVHSHAVRRLRYLRQGGMAEGCLARAAEIMGMRLDLDVAKIIAESKFAGPTNGYPFLVDAELKAKRSDDHAGR